MKSLSFPLPKNLQPENFILKKDRGFLE
jgi:hypothetical protein